MLNQAKNIFIVGIKGVAMANLAVILKKMGKKVSGSDVDEEFITDELLDKNNIPIQIGFDPHGVPEDTDLLIYSSGHQGQNNTQIAHAKKRGIKTVTQAEFLGYLLGQFKTSIAVSGSHGKTTTSSLLSYALIKLGVKPSYLVGSSSFNSYPGGDYDKKDYFVIEADEYGVNPPYDLTPKFHFLNPRYILCTNIDFDHPDVYKNLDEVKKAYLKFFNISLYRYNDIESKLFFCADDENLMYVAKQLPRKSYLTYGYSKNADLRIINPEIHENYSSFDLNYIHVRHAGGSKATDSILKDSIAPFSRSRMTIKLFGKKNISNTAGLILTLLKLGFQPDKIKSAIQDFTGAKRRFEKIYSEDETYLFDDYAHHPNEIAATISATRNRFPKKRIIIIFQPHTYSRTQTLLKDFATSLSLADKAFILPIFASARENPENYNITSRDLARFNPKKLTFVESKNNLISYLLSHIKSRDIIFTMGAGDVYKLKNDIIDIVRKIK